MNFIDTFLERTQHYESPSSFWKWSSYTTVAAVLRDNCYKPDGNDRLYPNIYVLLLADSAAHRKGRPVRLCRKLTEALGNTKVIAGRSSIQAILDELARAETNKDTGRVLKGGAGVFVAEELAASIVSDPAAVEILTDIYSYHEKYTHRLRGLPSFDIHNLCFTLMAASNLELLRSTYDTRAIFGGLLGRTFLVTPDEERPGNSLWQDMKFRSDDLISHLNKLANLKGEFCFTSSAQKAYDEWYFPFRDAYMRTRDKSGILGRVHTSVLKVAMILGANYTENLIIDEAHIKRAITECMDLLPNYQLLVMGAGKSSISEAGTIVLTDMYAAQDHLISKKTLLQRHWNSFDTETLSKLTDTLTEAGMITTTFDANNEIAFKMTKKCIELLFEKEKKQ